MDRKQFADARAIRQWSAYVDYCETGSDKPTWLEWVKQMDSLLAKHPQRSILSLSVQAIGR